MKTLSVHKLNKFYRSRQVVNDINLNIQAGEVVGLLGPNGAGKTTSFYMIIGLIACDSGTIKLNGERIDHLPVHKRARMGLGYLPQEASIFKQLTVEENILSILESRITSRSTIKERLGSLLQELHIAHLKKSLGSSLSGGERRRTEIARALASNPDFLLLDEPFAGVDPIAIHDIQDIIKQLCQNGIGILITDHNVRETLHSCDRAYIVHDGKIIAEGTPDHILKNEQVINVYLGKKFSL